ncbi:PREDICTED: T-lymphocyte activation antigen CD80 [Hipposideros armiger]|uniref:T-lymphocyte activation antigen CD80 n=1 Tax=Hipposideros armiger TaxID=186990 RepID=A0A8B7S5Y3_HIPAR|nr:PREDICTED: T-lymphocyte activation antigen CD80 [Hipposideros armiger]
MDQTLKPSKSSYLKFFQLLVLAHLYFCSGITQVTKTVKDVAVLSCGYNISTDELKRVRIYWQKHDEMVLAVISGNVKVWPKYENRTFTDISNNLSIVILALRLSDNGKYTCVIQKNKTGSYKREHLSSVMLSVRADFPVPSITELENPSTNLKRITCSTAGGFPKPQLSWLENGKELNASNTSISQDPETELYSISSELDFNVKNNHSFKCLVKYGDLTVSNSFDWQGYKPSPSFLKLPWYGLIPLLIILTVIVIVTTAGIRRCLHNRLPARLPERRRNRESIEMEVISPMSTCFAEESG